MTIPVKRFNILDGENQLATTDFLSANGLSILNLPYIDDIPSDVLKFIESGLQASGLSDLVNTGVSSAIAEAVRTGKGIVSSISDITGLDQSELTGLISQLTSGDVSVTSLLSRLDTNTLNNIAGTVIGGVPFIDTLTDNAKLLTDAVNKLSNGQFIASLTNNNQLVNGITALSKAAANMNISGVFQALQSGVDTGVLSKASVALLNDLSVVGNIPGMLDVLGSSQNLNIQLQSPDIITTILNTFKNAGPIAEKDYNAIVQQFNTLVNNISDNWQKSLTDDILAISAIGNNPIYQKINQSSVMLNVFPSGQLNVVPDSNAVFINAALGVV